MPTSTSRRRRWMIVSERNSSTPKWAKAVASRGISETRNVVAFRSRSSSKNWKISFRGLSNGARAYSASRLSSAIRSQPISSLYRASWRRRPRSHRGCSRTSSISRRNARTSMMCTPFACPESMPSEVICEMSEVRLCSIDRYSPEAPCSFASGKRMRYTNDDFREPGGPATRTMCPRGMPPLRRSSRPTTYVGILSVACDRMEPPPDPTAGTGQRPPADKTLSREVYGHHTGFESGGGNASTGGRPAVPPEPLSVRRCSGGDSMPATVVVGAQFGDEGKGEIVDYLADRADVVVRFQGVANAGHTVQVGDQLYAFHLLPSGVLRKRTMNVIGNGVVVDPAQLLTEIEETRALGHSVQNLRISDRAHVVMPYHKIIDGLEEKLKGNLGAGTTLRGIGPSFEDKVGRFGIRMCDLVDPLALREKLETMVPIN